MPFNANFTGATLETDGTLRIDGTSLPVDGPTSIVVSLVHDQTVRAESVVNLLDVPWKVRFAPGATAFPPGGEVFVVGIATRDGHDPFVWQGGFVLGPKRDTVEP